MFVSVPNLPYDPSFHDEAAVKRDKKKKQKDLPPSLPTTHREAKPEGYLVFFFFTYYQIHSIKMILIDFSQFGECRKFEIHDGY